MKTIKYMGLAALISVVAAQNAVATDNSEAGRKLVQSCEGCHAIEGYSNAFPAYQVPRLGGQHAEYVVSALRAYRDGARVHGSMVGHSSSMSERDFRNIAAYVSRFRGAGLNNSVTGNPAAGKEKAGMCAGCHDESGASVDMNNPRLAGQHESYLVQAMKDYKAGIRKNSVMNGMASGLSDNDIVDIAAYYSSQKEGLMTLPNK